MEDMALLTPVIAEGCNVSLSELDQIYSFWGLVQLNLLLEIRAESVKKEPTNNEDVTLP